MVGVFVCGVWQHIRGLLELRLAIELVRCYSLIPVILCSFLVFLLNLSTGIGLPSVHFISHPQDRLVIDPFDDSSRKSVSRHPLLWCDKSSCLLVASCDGRVRTAVVMGNGSSNDELQDSNETNSELQKQLRRFNLYCGQLGIDTCVCYCIDLMGGHFGRSRVGERWPMGEDSATGSSDPE